MDCCHAGFADTGLSTVDLVDVSLVNCCHPGFTDTGQSTVHLVDVSIVDCGIVVRTPDSQSREPVFDSFC